MGNPQKPQEEDCLRVLEKVLDTKDFQLESFQVLNFCNPLLGLVGEHFILRVEYVYKNDSHSRDFFVKTLSTNPLMMELSKSVMVYEKEAFFYNLLEECERYNIDTSFAPRGYFFRPFVTVLQDLSKQGYKGTPKKHLLDLQHCQICMDTIAKFHAASIVYEKRKSEELGRKYSLREEYSDVLEDKFAAEEDTLATRSLTSSFHGLLGLIDLIPEDRVSRDDFKAALSQLLTVDSHDDSLLSGVIHGDLWTSNFLYTYEEGEPTSAKLLDYQMVKYGPVELDLVEFLMTNTSKAFRDVHFAGLIERYHGGLSAALARAGLAEFVPSRAGLVRSCENFKLAGKIHAVIDHSFTFIDDGVYAEATRTEEGFREFLFEGRGRCVEECFRRSGEFRERLTEDVLEVRDMLFP